MRLARNTRSERTLLSLNKRNSTMDVKDELSFVNSRMHNAGAAGPGSYNLPEIMGSKSMLTKNASGPQLSFG